MKWTRFYGPFVVYFFVFGVVMELIPRAFALVEEDAPFVQEAIGEILLIDQK